MVSSLQFFPSKSFMHFSSIQHTPHFSSIQHTPHFSPIQSVSIWTLLLVFGAKHKPQISSICNCLSPPVTTSLLGLDAFHTILFFNIHTLCASINTAYQVSDPYNTTGRVIALFIVIFTFLRSRKFPTVPFHNNNIIASYLSVPNRYGFNEQIAWRWHTERPCRIIIIGIQPLGRFGQGPELSQATGIALVRCFLGKFLGIVYRCFSPRLEVPTFATRRLHVRHNARDPGGGRWNCGRECCPVILPKWRLPRHLGIFYMPQIYDFICGFTSLPKEGVLGIFSPLKIRRLRPSLNPRTWVLKASMLPLDHRRIF